MGCSQRAVSAAQAKVALGLRNDVSHKCLGDEPTILFEVEAAHSGWALGLRGKRSRHNLFANPLAFADSLAPQSEGEKQP